MKKIILASASPRRKRLLDQIGLKFTVDESGFEEDMNLKMRPHDLAKFLSLKKAQKVARKYKNSIIIGADTFVMFNGKLLGKAHSKEEAREILIEINGKPHEVITGFTIIDTRTGKTISKSVQSRVYMKKMTKGEIDAYVRSEEPIGKAGAYAVQEKGALFVEKVEGDFYNVVGLPIIELTNQLKKFGIKIL